MKLFKRLMSSSQSDGAREAISHWRHAADLASTTEDLTYTVELTADAVARLELEEMARVL